MKTNAMALIFPVLCLSAYSATAVETGTIQVRSNSKLERIQATYDCGAAGRLAVTYINADPNYLAQISLPKQPQALLFASVISGSGTRYAAGKYIWWTKGNSASLYDATMGDNAAPTMTCKSIN